MDLIKPYCFVLMPFGKKQDLQGNTIDFDEVYENLIEPAITVANLTPIRADQEVVGGIIHKAMFERLMLCDYAVADLTLANANVFYELGVRHGIRPFSTLHIAAEGTILPFDATFLRTVMYQLNDKGTPGNATEDQKVITKFLEAAKKSTVDSPVYQLITDMVSPDIAHLKTDTFREQVEESEKARAHIRRLSKEENPETLLREFETELGDLANVDVAIIIELLLTYRDISAWQQMIDLVEKMPVVLADVLMVQEQLGLALNRNKQHDEAERVLMKVITEHGTSSETNGILGRVYKDLWKKYREASPIKGQGYLNKAIESYLTGFKADWRDAYPGINALTLMEMKDPVDPRQEDLFPVVKYAVEQRLDKPNTDYWDHATLVEYYVLKNVPQKAIDALTQALTMVSVPWEAQTTADNLELIKTARLGRQEDVSWLDDIINELLDY